MDVDWEPGSRTVRWAAQGTVERSFRQPPVCVVGLNDPPGVLVVEVIGDVAAEPSNALVLGVDGTERLRLAPPPLPERSWRIGYHTAYRDPQGQLVAVYATRVGDLWGRPDLRTGELLDVREWR